MRVVKNLNGGRNNAAAPVTACNETWDSRSGFLPAIRQCNGPMAGGIPNRRGWRHDQRSQITMPTWQAFEAVGVPP